MIRNQNERMIWKNWETMTITGIATMPRNKRN